MYSKFSLVPGFDLFKWCQSYLRFAVFSSLNIKRRIFLKVIVEKKKLFLAFKTDDVLEAVHLTYDLTGFKIKVMKLSLSHHWYNFFLYYKLFFQPRYSMNLISIYLLGTDWTELFEATYNSTKLHVRGPSNIHLG